MLPELIVDEISYWLWRLRMDDMCWEMKERFQRARYDLLVRGLQASFLTGNLFPMGHFGVVVSPWIQYGGLKFDRVDYFAYPGRKLPEGTYAIRALMGFGYVMWTDLLYFRPGTLG